MGPSVSFPVLTAGLERELAVQHSIAESLEGALTAASSRRFDEFQAHLESIGGLSARAQALAREREASLGAAAVGARRPSLADLAEIPGAPRETLHGLREKLRAATVEVTARATRLRTLARELADVYGGAVAVLLRAAGVETDGASAPPGGRLVNVEV